VNSFFCNILFESKFDGWKDIAISLTTTFFFLLLLTVILLVFKSKLKTPLRVFFSLLALFILLLIGIDIYRLNYFIKERRRIKLLIQNHIYHTVEGEVQNFDPMPKQGKKLESFTVDGFRFSYHHFESTSFFYHHAASHGGVIKENGQKVKIDFIVLGSNNSIIKIESID
jgi:hypothetical protein